MESLRGYYLTVVLLGFFLSVGYAEISTIFSVEEVSGIKAKALSSLSRPGSLHDAFYSVQILEATKVAQYSCDCASIKRLINGKTSNIDTYYGISSSNACKCGVEASSDAKAAVVSGLKSNDLYELSWAALACTVAEISTNEDVVGRLKSLMASDGTFRSSIGSKESSVDNAKLALTALAAYRGAKSQSVLDEVAETALLLLPNGDDESLVDPTILFLLSKMSSKKPRLVGPRLDAVAESLLQLRHSNDLQVSAGVLQSLNIVMTYKSYPVYVSIRSSIIGSDAISKILVVDVMDVFGGAVVADTIEAKSVKNKNKEAVIYQGVLDKNSLDLSAQNGIVPGLYSMELAITLPGQKNVIASTLNFVVHGKVEIVNVAVGVSDKKTISTVDLIAVAGQNQVTDISASAIASDFVHLSFGVSSPGTGKAGKRFQKPHQVFVKFTHVESGSSSFFVGMADGQLVEGAGSKYRAAVSLSKEVETFSHSSGPYTISLLVSDVSYDTPLEWIIGSIDLTFPKKVVKDSPLYAKPLMYTSDNTLSLLPEIKHVMRPESKRASAFMSTIFSALALSPLVAFIGYILSLSPNLKRLQSLSSMLFVGCLLVTLLLYASYWLALEGVNFYDTIKYLCFLIPITIFIGSRAVNSVAETRVKETTK